MRECARYYLFFYPYIPSQVTGTVLVLIGQALETDLPKELWPQSQCSVDDVSESPCFNSIYNISIQNSTALDPKVPQDLTYTGLFYMGLMSLNFLIFVVAFRPRYRRLQADRRAKKCKNLKEEFSNVEENVETEDNVIPLEIIGNSASSSSPAAPEQDQEETKL